jgi:hypothetical protein
MERWSESSPDARGRASSLLDASSGRITIALELDCSVTEQRYSRFRREEKRREKHNLQGAGRPPDVQCPIITMGTAASSIAIADPASASAEPHNMMIGRAADYFDDGSTFADLSTMPISRPY